MTRGDWKPIAGAPSEKGLWLFVRCADGGIWSIPWWARKEWLRVNRHDIRDRVPIEFWEGPL